MYDVTLSVPDFNERQTLLFCLLVEEQSGKDLINVAVNEKGEILVKFLKTYTNEFFKLVNNITSNFSCNIHYLQND